MERFSFDQELVVEKSPRNSRESSKKRKWREIEALQDKKRLQKELELLDCTLDLDDMPTELEL